MFDALHMDEKLDELECWVIGAVSGRVLSRYRRPMIACDEPRAARYPREYPEYHDREALLRLDDGTLLLAQIYAGYSPSSGRLVAQCEAIDLDDVQAEVWAKNHGTSIAPHDPCPLGIDPDTRLVRIRGVLLTRALGAESAEVLAYLIGKYPEAVMPAELKQHFDGDPGGLLRQLRRNYTQLAAAIKPPGKRWGGDGWRILPSD